MSRKIILIKQELLLLVYELNRSGLLAENEKIRPILAQLEKLLLCDLSPSRSEERFSRNAETDLVCRLLLEKKKKKEESSNCETQAEQKNRNDTAQARPHQQTQRRAIVARATTTAA